MNQEELKTCLGQLLSDLRCNWAYEYYDRLEKALELCDKIEDDTTNIEDAIAIEFNNNNYSVDGRIFRRVDFYNYYSNEGVTEKSKEWCKNNLTHFEYSVFSNVD